MDKMLRAEIMGEVRRAMQESLEMYREEWVTDKELMKHVQCLNKTWFKTYGHTLPREQVVVTEKESGKPHYTSWCYPLHKIQRMLSTGELKNITI